MAPNNPFDNESVDEENGNWAEETPETNYFKMMMQDNEAGRITADDRDADDSVLGGATLASMMGNDKKKNMKSTTKSSSTGGYSMPHRDPTPAETLSIVGIEDDVSTIANDTVNETTKAFFTNNGTREATQPRIRLFKEYNTPQKSKKKSEGSTEDDETAPETPPGMIRVPGRSSSTTPSDAEAGKETKKKKKSTIPPIRSKRVYIVAGVLAVILFASIIALSVALSGMRDKNGGSPDSSVEDGGDILDTWPDLDTGNQDSGEGGTSTDTPSLGEGESTLSPSSDSTDSSTDSLTSTTPAPTFPTTTVSPSITPLDTEATFEELYTLLVERGAISEDIQDNPNTPQFQAMTWLSEDPNFYNYLESRMMQRWSLAVLAFSFDASRGQGTGRMNRRLLQGWLEYTNECTWFTSAENPVCDDRGNFERLSIKDLQLEGNLPSEIALLSNSLRFINLDGNKLQGLIPTELGELTILESLSMRRNSFDGSLISEVGQLTNLVRLNLGRNQLSGRIPAEIGNMRSLEILRLDHNDLFGEIPGEIASLAPTLESLSLNDNFLSGRIPNDISDLDNLEALYIGNNDLSGDLPRNVCKIRNLEVISVDCEAQGCQCCTECADEIDETEAPTAAAQTTSSPTQAPTSSVPTTNAPTKCVDVISSLDSCIAPDEAISLKFINCNPLDDDWVAIYQADQDYSRLPNPPAWSWACGTRNCREAVSSQEMSLSSVHAASNAWPLQEGEYVVVLARNSAQPYEAFAVSAEFSIRRGC